MTPIHWIRALLAIGCLVFAAACSSDSIGSTDNANNSNVASCGNGQQEGPEQCDGADLVGNTCESIGFSDGTLGCQPDCTFDSSDCHVVDTCGNGVIDPPMEECDGPFLNGSTCTDLGYDDGILACDAGCTYDTSDCTIAEPLCGNGHVDTLEVCDGYDLTGLSCEDLGFYSGTLSCQHDCSDFDTTSCFGICGDEVFNGAETCDGTDFGGDSCIARGFYAGVLTCDASCTTIDDAGCADYCGDGISNGTESCDGTDFGGDTCIARGFYRGALVCDSSCAAVDQAGCTGVCGDATCDAVDGETSFSCLDCQGFKAISAGGLHTCAIRSDDTAWCWGQGRYGKLGDGLTHGWCGSYECSLVPVQAVGLTDVVSLSAGWNHSCAVLSDGTAWCWGQGEELQLGVGTSPPATQPTPIQVSSLTDAVAISAGGNHTCALRSDGTVWCWGNGSHGVIGNGSTAYAYVPVLVSNLTTAVTISAGAAHNCAVLSDGTAWCWGWGYLGRLGDGLSTDSSIPVQASGLSNAKVIGGGGEHSCAASTDGTAWCWGYGINGALGLGSFLSPNTPAQVVGIINATEITTGDRHSCASLSDGSAWCWGDNYSSQLGDGSANDSTSPVQVANIASVEVITAGMAHTCAVQSSGTAWCWGNNYSGQLGTGSNTDSSVPVQVIYPP